MGEFKQGKFHGKGLFYRHAQNAWELNEYAEGKVQKGLRGGEGKPESLEISKEIAGDEGFQEIYIKPKDMCFEHY